MSVPYPDQVVLSNNELHTKPRSMLQSSQPKRLFPLAHAMNRRVTVAIEKLVKIARMTMDIGALF